MKIKNRLIVKMVFFYTILVIVAFGSIFAFVSVSYSKHILVEKENVYHQKTDILAEQLNTAIRKIYSLHSEANLKINHLDAEENSPVLEALRTKYAAVRSVYLYDASGNLVSYAADSLAGIPEFTGLDPFISSKAYRHFTIQDNDLIYYGSIFTDQDSSYHYNAYITVILNKNRFFYNLIQDSAASFDGICITDDQNMILLNGQEIDVQTVQSTAPSSNIKLDGKKFMLFKQLNRVYSEWTMSNLVDYSAISRDIAQLGTLLAFIACMCVLLIMVISFFISRQITRPIFQVNQAMREVEQ